jgi:hypothetical protein
MKFGTRNTIVVTTMEGRASELISDPRIIDAYLGA